MKTNGYGFFLNSYLKNIVKMLMKTKQLLLRKVADLLNYSKEPLESSKESGKCPTISKILCDHLYNRIA